MPKKIDSASPAKDRIPKIIEILKKEYEPVCALNFETPFQLLIATILSAQCTDERVNKVTKDLFEKFPNAKALSEADPDEVEEMIRPTGFFRQKAKSLLAVSKAIVEEFKGKVPKDMDALTKLPGIGRKTANVVLGTAYGFPAITVDTHVKRLSNRLQLTNQTNPDKIERDLIALIPENERTDFSHRLIWHGRKVCHARKPQCAICRLAEYCPSEEQS